MSFSAFKKEFFVNSGSKTQPASASAEQAVADMVAVRLLIVSKDDCLNSPEMFQEIRTFKLPEKIMAQYNRLYAFCIFALQASEKNGDGVCYSSACRLAVFTKLREVASGFLIDEYGSTSWLHDGKIMELIKIVEEHPDEQMVDDNNIDFDYMKELRRKQKMDRNISYEIMEHIGVLSENSKGWRRELNLVSWNGYRPKYDLRDWAPDHEKMGKGITLTNDEMEKLKELLKGM